MNRTATIGWLFLSAAAPALAQGTVEGAVQGAASRTQDAEIKQIAEALAQLEARTRSLSLRMATRGVYPGGQAFRTEGSMRVLEGTHFHVETVFHVGDDLSGSSEVVRTPAGVRILDRDPAFGEHLLEIPGGPVPGEGGRVPLLVELDAASRILGGDREILGVFGNGTATPLGSVLLAELDRSFALRVVGRGERDGTPGRRIEGRLRQGDEGPAVPPLADRVELFVRDSDGALVHMAQYQGAQVLAEVAIRDLELDVDLDPASFSLDPRGLRPRDAREHPQHRYHIRKVLSEARELRRERLEAWIDEGSRSWQQARADAAEAMGWAPWEVDDAFDALGEAWRERRERLQRWLKDGDVALADAEGVLDKAAQALQWSPQRASVVLGDLRLLAWVQEQEPEVTLDGLDDEQLAEAGKALDLPQASLRDARERLRAGPSR